jgi:predicted ATPase/DNA-binding CsgD family transcriptional regulator
MHREHTGAVTTVEPAKGSAVTTREAEVLALLAQHLTNAQIADALYISVRTVESHVSALLRKLHYRDRRSLARHADFEASAAGKRTLHHWPSPVTPLIGRSAERAALAIAIAEHRMVTVTGPGGIGKTRLALSVAADVASERRHGAWFVDLVRVTDPAMVVAAIADTVGVPEQRSASVGSALMATLAEADALLVLDNCEHLLNGVRPCVERILASCPDVTVLATSRSRLLVPYEWIYEAPGMSVTDDGGDAVDLFTARVAAATGDPAPPDHPRVAALCRALDGIALAIELAAARYSTLGLDGLEAAIEEPLRFLTAGTRVADRHRSLRDAISWSFELLQPEDRALLRDISVLASWFDVDAARAIAGPSTPRPVVADGLARLASDSMLAVQRGEPTRYRALETIRQYGVERLDADGALDAVRVRHEQWCRAETAALSAGEPDDAWCERFDRVVDDVRAALLWSAADQRRRDQTASLAAEFAGLLFVRGRLAEAQRRYEQAAELAPATNEQAVYLRLAAGAATSRYVGNETLRLLRAASEAASSAGDRGSAARDLAWMSIYMNRSPGIMADKPALDEAAALRVAAQEISDGSPLAEAAITTAAAFGALAKREGSSISAPSARHRAVPGVADRDAAVLELSRRAVALSHQVDDSVTECAALDQLCMVFQQLGDIPEAMRVVEHRLDLIHRLPVTAASGFEFTDTYLMASDVHVAAGDLAGAGDYADRLASLPFYRDEEHLGIARRLTVDALTGNLDDVVRNGELFRDGWKRAGRPAASDLGKATYAVAMVHGILGDDERRAEWVRMTIDLGVAPDRLRGCATGWAPTFDALLALHRHDAGAALERLSADLDDPQTWTWSSMLWRPWYAALAAEAAALDNRDDVDTFIERSRHAARDNPIAAAIVERAAAIASGANESIERFASTFSHLGCPYQRTRTATLAGHGRSAPRC